MKLSEAFKKIDFYKKYRALCLEFIDIQWGNPRPKKEEILSLLKGIGYDAIYIHADRVYICKLNAGNYSFEYYFEFTGAKSDVYLYIKRTAKDWPVKLGLSGVLIASNIYPKQHSDELGGYFLFTPGMTKIEEALKKIKPLLDDLKEEIMPSLVNDQIEFDVVV